MIMAHVAWVDDEQIVSGLDREDAVVLFSDDEDATGILAGLQDQEREQVRVRLDHQHRRAWYSLDPAEPGSAPEIEREPNGAAWRETDYAAVLDWAWDQGLLLGPRDAAYYEDLDPRMQVFICRSEVYAVSDDGFVVDTDLQRSVTESELRVEMALAGGAEFCGAGCQGE
jgi:hypothetical protein